MRLAGMSIGVCCYANRPYHANPMGRTQAAPKKQHIVKTSAATLNKSKKKKSFFSFLNF
jgi:hypothetical protein